MSKKTEKELAFLRDLYIDADWTQRFTDLVDDNIELGREKKLLYINAGTGNHVLALSAKMKKKETEFFAVCENRENLTIARDKAAAVKSAVEFSMKKHDDGSFDAVIADASWVRPDQIKDFVGEVVRVTEPNGKVAFFTPSAGSFGEVFSLLWEVFFNEDLGDHGHVAEQLISEIPTVSDLEDAAREAGLTNIASKTGIEIFEYKDGSEFVGSPLVADFLMPVWLSTLPQKDRTKVKKRLAALIDDEDGSLTFRFSVKATLVTGEKI